MKKINVCIAGATGWAGSALSLGVINHPNMNLTCGVSRSHQNQDLADILNTKTAAIGIYASVEQALKHESIDVMVEYTQPDTAKQHVLAAINHGVNVLIGTSGLTENDYQDIETQAEMKQVSVLAVGNFALTAVLLQKFSAMAAQYISNFEIIDYAGLAKTDSPSGTVRELANRLSQITPRQSSAVDQPVDNDQASRGALINGVTVHSVRLPGHVLGVETLFGLPDEKLSIKHDSGSSAQPYVGGALMAIKKIHTLKGLNRGLESVMTF